VSCWGWNWLRGVERTPVLTFGARSGASFASQIASIDSVTIAAGGAHVCLKVTPSGPTVRSSLRGVLCFGDNASAQLGDGTLETRLLPNDVLSADFTRLVAAAGSDTAIQAAALASGARHSCAIVGATLPGRVWCWGANGSGQLGAASTDTCRALESCSTHAVAVGTTTTFLQVAAGAEHTCALTDVGVVWCWGSNAAGQLGRGTAGGTRLAPLAMPGSQRFVAITTGASHTCGRTTDGSLYCWGSNDKGQLGDGTFVTRASPVRVSEPPL
jgi:alpha-tubulin suppressor-like RCC1 family protein